MEVFAFTVLASALGQGRNAPADGISQAAATDDRRRARQASRPSLSLTETLPSSIGFAGISLFGTSSTL